MRVLLFFIAFMSSFYGMAQSTMEVSLDTLTILDQKQAFGTGQKINQSVSVLNPMLAQGYYVRSYGLSGLGTAGMRGGNGNQTLITWQGTPITNPMAGITDLNQIPFSLWQNTTVYIGGEGATFGSNAVVGVVDIGQKTNEKDGLYTNLSSEIGVFSTQNYILNAGIKKDRWSLSATQEIFRSDNDFEYKLDQKFTRKNENASVKKFHSLLNGTIKLSKNQTIKSSFWRSLIKSNIPATTVQTKSEAYQQDSILRAQISHEWTRKSFAWVQKITFQNEQNHYVDPTIRLDAFNQFKQTTLESILKKSIGSDWITLSAQAITSTGESKNYKRPIEETRFALSANYTVQKRFVGLKFGLRKDILESTNTNLVPQSRITLDFGKYRSHLSVQRLFRLPTFNERYWFPGGDLNILPETGFNIELGQEVEILGVKVQGSIYQRKMKNQILWLPKPNAFQFFAQNIQATSTNGLDLQINKSVRKGIWLGEFDASYAYVDATSASDIAFPKLSKGDELYYVPKHFGHLKVKNQFDKTWLTMSTNMSSEAKGFNETIPKFFIVDFEIGRQIDFRNNVIKIGLNCHNLTNKTYYIFDRRPMMGRFWSITAKYEFSK